MNIHIFFSTPKSLGLVPPFLDLQMANSSDAGVSFAAPITVEGQGIIGRVGVALLDEQSGIAAWMETTTKGTYLMAARIDSGGKMGKRWEIGKMDSGRKSRFP